MISINTYAGPNGTPWQKLSARSRNEEEFNTLLLEDFKGHKCASGREAGSDFSRKLWDGEIKNINIVEGE
jgi:hypothetical protein